MWRKSGRKRGSELAGKMQIFGLGGERGAMREGMEKRLSE